MEFDRLLQTVEIGLKEVELAAPSSRPQAAVLILLQEGIDGPEVVLTQRADHMRLHPGEIAFPGGRWEPGDSDEWHTALRETEEELALPSSKVRPLGRLEHMVTRSEIEVSPCVGYLDESFPFLPNLEELNMVFSAPLAFFAAPDNLLIEEITIDKKLQRVPHYQFGKHDIWGVTAFMLVRLANIGFKAGIKLRR